MRLSAPVYQLKRRARTLARDEKIALHEALDRVAREEGFARWSLLTSQLATSQPARALLAGTAEGQILLLGARPGHGKTLLALQLLIEAAREGRRAVFFTLEYTREETSELVRSLGESARALADKLEIVVSDEISADFIIEHLSGSSSRAMAIVDYLQILDQQRRKPPLSEQMLVLREFARTSGTSLAFLSQIDRSFAAESKRLPELRDVRLPNPVELGVFSKACFLHNGTVQLHELA
jgi:replicative DNA helicase